MTTRCLLLRAIETGDLLDSVKKKMTTHKYFACSFLICMIMAIYTGHKMIAPKKKTD